VKCTLCPMCITDRPFGHLVKSLVVSDVDYNYFDVTSIEPSYGELIWLLSPS